ncbi:TIGR04282 family arsenosugar biosynthesis glycosyltransferase [Emcibacter sp.]|uniref:TIGR04282 family arsenosugar biosynthesis glycosyltransferase n=1 Tax=Emcibacter sp. TaxID=1979954 RepID=UPI002AA921E7|nr:TIGR04282 family arsenosugar biosynthesis glycosyltransferase [Emcibacter sp.]
MVSSRHLVIFLKAPRIGTVKTRLARDLGRVPAWVFYRRQVQKLIRRLRDPRWEMTLFVSPDRFALSGNFWPHNLLHQAQGRGDLGQRMQRAFDGLPSGPAVIIGGDIPDITKADISAAFRSLENHDMTFGPAEDGGYWLVGMRRRPRILRPFEKVRWSTEHALEDTLANIHPECRIARLRTLTDIDDITDFERAGLPRPL